MKIFRYLTLIIFAVVLVAFAITFYNVRSGLDYNKPVITVQNEALDVDVNITEQELLSGVTAVDEKDGDLTDKVMIQDISKFVGDSTSIVTYIVCDSDNNLAKAKQKIHYTNYVPPKIKLSAPLLFPTSSSISLSQIIGADDVIDGDISTNVVINSSTVDNTKDGIYSVNLSVFNSKGDRVSYDLPVKIYTVNKKANCNIGLSSYLIYTKVGEEIDPLSYVGTVADSSGNALSVQPIVEGYVDINQPGGYAYYFSLPDDSGYTANTALTVIVTE